MSDFIGYDRVISNLDASLPYMKRLIWQKYYDAANNTYSQSQGDVPVDTGDLKDSGKVEYNEGDPEFFIDVTYGDGSSTPTTYSYDGVSADGYSWFNELGTKYMGATPYLGPAFDKEAQDLMDTLDGLIP